MVKICETRIVFHFIDNDIEYFNDVSTTKLEMSTLSDRKTCIIIINIIVSRIISE